MKKDYMNSLSGQKIIKDQSLLRHEDIRHKIRILPELQSFIPPLLPDERAQLESNIRKDGCREALLIWETTEGILANSNDSTPVYILVDGHNRYGICQENGIDFRVNLKPFSGMDEVRAFMIENQLGRRNLTPEQTAYLRGLRYRDEKGERGKYSRDTHKGQNVPNADEDSIRSSEIASTGTKSSERTSTAQMLAKQFNVNEKTIKRDAEFAAGIDKLAPALKADVLFGKTSVKKILIQQLAKSDAPDGSVASLDLVETNSSPISPNVDQAVSGEIGKKRVRKLGRPVDSEKLLTRLKILIGKVSSPTDADVQLCDDIVACASQLKAALLENHKEDGRKNH